MNNSDCIFCKIAAGTLPCFKLYEDERHVAFLDINPANPGHVLVVPKRHSKGLLDADDADLAATLPLAKLIASVLDGELRPDGINLHQANGPGAAQSVFHFHLHIVPRRIGDGLLMNWPLIPGDRAAIQALADRLKAGLEQRLPVRA